MPCRIFFNINVSYDSPIFLLCFDIIESEWKALSRCRRVWAAMALGAILKGQSALAEISSTFECEVGELEDLKRSTKVSAIVRVRVRDRIRVKARVRARGRIRIRVRVSVRVVVRAEAGVRVRVRARARDRAWHLMSRLSLITHYVYHINFIIF